MSTMIEACDECLRRSWLVSRLSPHLDRVRGRAQDALALDTDSMLSGLAGRAEPAVRAELEALDLSALRARVSETGQHAACRCAHAYPERLRELSSAPAVLYCSAPRFPNAHPERGCAVAVVGSRGPSPYGLEAALMLARGLAAAGVSVVSGMAFGIDAAAHEGALKAGGETVCVLPGPVERPYPRAHRTLFARIKRHGAALSELPPGGEPRRWSFTARNRIIAGLSDMTVVVEAKRYSGSLVTARVAQELGRPVGAVPGRVNWALAEGPHDLLRGGAILVRSVEDVLEELPGTAAPTGGAGPPGEPGARLASSAARPTAQAEPLSEAAQQLHAELVRTGDLNQAAAAAGLDPGGALAAVAELELGGYVRRGPGSSYEPRM